MANTDFHGGAPTKQVATIVASLAVSACGALVGIDTDLGVKPDTSGSTDPTTDKTTDTGKAPVPVDGGKVIRQDASSSHLDSSIPFASRPPEGTYTYEAAPNSGDYVTALVPLAPYTSVTAAIAYDGPDCFNQTFTFRTNYTEVMRFCVKGYELAEVSETRDIALGSLVIVHTDETSFGGDGGTPGDVYFSTVAKPGTSWSHYLTGKNRDSAGGTSSFTASGTYGYIGDENDKSKHFHDSRAVDGGERGQDTVDWYFSPVDGTLVRFTRTLDIDYPFGTGVHYHEWVDMTLAARPGATDAGTH
jgi:hypothetical protein